MSQIEDIIILDEDFAAFDGFDFDNDDCGDSIDTKMNNINLPDDESVKNNGEDDVIEFITPNAAQLETTKSNPKRSQHKSSHVRLSFHDSDDGTINDNPDSTSMDDIDTDIINSNDFKITQGDAKSPQEIIMSSDDFFGADDNDNENLTPNDINNSNNFDDEIELKPVEGDDQLRDYFNFLAQQLEDGHGGDQIRHLSDEDEEWQEHDNKDLSHISLQSNEDIKIKTKQSNIKITMKMQGSDNNDNSKNDLNNNNIKKAASLVPPHDIKSSLPLPEDTFGDKIDFDSLDIATSTESPLQNTQSKSTLESTSTAGLTSSSSIQAKTTSKNAPKKPLLAVPDDIAALLSLTSIPIPTSSEQITTDDLTNPQDHHHNQTKASIDTDVLPTRYVKPSVVKLINTTNNNNDSNNDDFFASFDEGFLSPEELTALREKNQRIQQRQLQLQRERLAKLAVKDDVLLKQQQEAFLNRITRLESNIDLLINHNPLLALGINKNHVNNFDQNGGEDLTNNNINHVNSNNNNIQPLNTTSLENQPLNPVTNDNGGDGDDGETLTDF